MLCRAFSLVGGLYKNIKAILKVKLCKNITFRFVFQITAIDRKKDFIPIR